MTSSNAGAIRPSRYGDLFPDQPALPLILARQRPSRRTRRLEDVARGMAGARQQLEMQLTTNLDPKLAQMRVSRRHSIENHSVVCSDKCSLPDNTRTTDNGHCGGRAEHLQTDVCSQPDQCSSSCCSQRVTSPRCSLPPIYLSRWSRDATIQPEPEVALTRRASPCRRFPLVSFTSSRRAVARRASRSRAVPVSFGSESRLVSLSWDSAQFAAARYSDGFRKEAAEYNKCDNCLCRNVGRNDDNSTCGGGGNMSWRSEASGRKKKPEVDWKRQETRLLLDHVNNLLDSAD